MVTFASNIPNTDLFVIEHSSGPKSLHTFVYINPDTHGVEHNTKHFGVLNQSLPIDLQPLPYMAPVMGNAAERNTNPIKVSKFIAVINLSDEGFLVQHVPPTESNDGNVSIGISNSGGGDYTLWDSSGSDKLYGGKDNNMRGDEEDDVLWSAKLHDEEEDNVLWSGAGTEKLHIEEENDTLHGNTDKNKFSDNASDDTPHCNTDKNKLSSDASSDTPHDHTDKDKLNDDTGDDTMQGGAVDEDEADHDTFLFGTDDGADDEWDNSVKLVDVTEGPSESLNGPGTWTLDIINGAVATVDSKTKTVTFDHEAEGTITLSDGSTFDFNNIKEITW